MTLEPLTILRPLQLSWEPAFSGSGWCTFSSPSPLPVSPQTAPEASGGSKESSALLRLVSQGDPQDSLFPLAPSHVVCRPGALCGLLRGTTCSPYGLSWELASTKCGCLQPQQPSLPCMGMWGRGWWPPVHQELKGGVAVGSVAQSVSAFKPVEGRLPM